MELKEMIEISNEKLNALMDLREEVSNGESLYFETSRNNGTLPATESLVKAIDVLIGEHSKKHQELLKAIRHVESLMFQLELY